MTVQSYVIEIAGEAAGIVVAERGGFRFFTAGSACASLNQCVFTSVGSAERACRDLMEISSGRAVPFARAARPGADVITRRAS